jgi:sugar (pentulose or hexulose) kinase
MTPYLLAIDNGSQSTKVTIFDARGRPVASARRRLKPYDTSVPGHAIHPGDDIWDSIRDACRAAMAGFAGDPADIVAVGCAPSGSAAPCWRRTAAWPSRC